MEEKKTIKLSLQTVFLIIAIIIIIIMGMVIYKLNNDKTIETKRANELQSKTNELKNAVDDLNKTVSNNSNNSFTSNNNKDLVNKKIIGKWKASKVVDRHGNDRGLNSVWGSGISESNEMQFKENGILSYRIGITASSDDGVYSINGNTVNYEIPTDIKGEVRKGTYIYIPEEDVLKEDRNDDSNEDPEEKVTITYVRTDDNNIKESLQKYFDLTGALASSPKNVLVELGLLDKNDTSGEFVDVEGTPYITTNIKSSDFKNTMLKYITEKCYENEFSSWFKFFDWVYYRDGGATGRKFEVISVTKISDSEYNAKVNEIMTNGNKELQEYKVTIANNNGNYVVDSCINK